MADEYGMPEAHERRIYDRPPSAQEGQDPEREETIGDLIAKGRCPECGTLAGIWHKMGCPLDPDAKTRLKPTPNSGENISPQLIPDPRTDDSVTLYPHGGEREWSTVTHDEWKRSLGVEMVRAELLAAEREHTRGLLDLTEEEMRWIRAYVGAVDDKIGAQIGLGAGRSVLDKLDAAIEALSPAREGPSGGND